MLVNQSIVPSAYGLDALRVDSSDLSAPRVNYAVPAWLVAGAAAVRSGKLATVVLTHLKEKNRP